MLEVTNANNLLYKVICTRSASITSLDLRGQTGTNAFPKLVVLHHIRDATSHLLNW